MLSYAALCRRSGAKSLGQTLIVLNLAKASHSRKIAALRDFDPADVRFGSFTSFPPSRRVPFAPKSRHSASARVYEYTAFFCNGPGDVKSPRVMSRAELTLLSVVGAEAATLCCQKER